MSLDLRRLLFVSAYQTYLATLHGCAAPITGILNAALIDPQPGHLVMETSTIYMPERDDHRFGRLLRRPYEPMYTAEEWAERNDHPDREIPTGRVWYIERPDGTEYRWHNANFIRVLEETWTGRPSHKGRVVP